MNKNIKFAFALLLMGITISYKQSQSENSEATSDITEATADTTSVVSSSAAVEPKNSTRKFVRTADIKFESKKRCQIHWSN